jgi:secretion/DNA translocation related TadE-like protein
VSSSDEGSSTVLVMGFMGVLLSVGAVVAGAASVVVTRHRAETAADVVALAAAAKVYEGKPAACAEARRLARAHEVQLLDCRLEGLDAVVDVGLRPPGRLSALGIVHGRARAGRRSG